MIIRRVGVWSVARMYGALLAVGGLIGGLILAAFSLVGAGLAGAGLAGQNEDLPAFVGTAFGIGAVVFLPILYGAMGVIVGAVAGALYNLFAGILGGVEIDLT